MLRRFPLAPLFALALLAVVVPALGSDEGLAAAEKVSQTSYYDFMNNWLYTHTGNNRGRTGPQLIPARENIKNKLQSYGLTVVLEPFSYSGGTYHNVVATKTGTLYPSREYIIGAHYDSASNPGADDNASGVALVLEAARILSQYPSDCTIRFIAFSCEENGLIGSEAYVAAHPLDDIRGMISADMVAYDTAVDGLAVNVYGRTASNPIKTALANAITLYGDGLIPVVGGDEPYSDHAPFEADGLQACLLIEGEVWTNPYYHKQSDNFEQPGNLNFPYAIKCTRAAVGWLVDAAGVHVPYNSLKFQYPNGVPTISDPRGLTTFQVNVTGVGTQVPASGTAQLHYNVGAGWQTTPLAEGAPNQYTATLPAAACVEEIQFYVSAESTTGGVFTDPRTAPDAWRTATAAYGTLEALNQPLNQNPSWSVQGQWAFGHPTGAGSHDRDPNNGHTNLWVYGYNLAGDYPNGMTTPQYLTTPAIDCTGLAETRLEFWRWLGVESNSNYDKATIEVSIGGGAWQTVWTAASTGAAVSDSQWNLVSYAIPGADNQPDVRFRWGMGPTDSYTTYPGWNIDDIRVWGIDCTVPTGACCLPDYSCVVTTWQECTGTYAGDGVSCEAAQCPSPPLGACCALGGGCTVATQTDCLAAGGGYMGDGVSCSPSPCGCVGDANCDDAVTWRDIDYFVAGLNDDEAAWAALFASPGPACAYLPNLDINGDGHVTWRDIDPFIGWLNTTCPH